MNQTSLLTAIQIEALRSSHFLQANASIMQQIRPQQLFSISGAIHYCLITVSFHIYTTYATESVVKYILKK
jgi:hypothetical protein